MQTFLPIPDFARSAACLDRQRLGKQRVEVLQILRCLNGETTGWRNHPAVKMWSGHVEALVEYGCAVCDEWTGRGYNDTCRDKIVANSWGDEVELPPWFVSRSFHRSHQSNLVRKDADHYRRYFPNVPADLEYVWPVNSAASVI